MKIRIISTMAIVVIIAALSCKTIARAAARYWTNRQIKEFIGNCSAKAGKVIGDEKASKYCDCAVDVIAEKYRNYQDVKTISIYEILRIADGCR